MRVFYIRRATLLYRERRRCEVVSRFVGDILTYVSVAASYGWCVNGSLHLLLLTVYVNGNVVVVFLLLLILYDVSMKSLTAVHTPPKFYIMYHF